MVKSSRREFLKFSAATFFTLVSSTRLPSFAASSNLSSFKFAFVPDIHLSNYKFDNWSLLNESLLILQETIKTLNNLKPDFVLFGGDLIDNETKDLADLQTLVDVLYTLEVPYYVIMGNREAKLNNNLSKEDFACEFRRNGFSECNKTYWIENPVTNVDLIGLDSSVINQMSGEIPPEQLVWLSDKLQSSTNKVRIVALHHPVLPLSVNDKFYNASKYSLINSSLLQNVLTRSNKPNLVISGHHHSNKIELKDSIYYINSPSITTFPCEFRMIEFKQGFLEIKNYQITFKQMIKKGEEMLVNSVYAKEFPGIKPKELLQKHKGADSDRSLKAKLYI